MEFVFLAIGIVIGIVIGIYFQKSKAPVSSSLDIDYEQGQKKLEQQIHLLDKEKSVLEERIQNSIDKFKAQELNLDKVKTENIQLHNTSSKLETENKNLLKKLDEKQKETQELQQKLLIEFENIAGKIMKQSSAELTDTNQKKMHEVLSPLKEKMQEFETKVQSTYEKGLKERSVLAEQIKSLGELNQQMQQDAKNLTNALKGDSKTQGNWGEMQLEMILNKAGLEKDIHYTKEQNIKTEAGDNQRLDYIINLPDNKHLILDSKVSLTAYNNYYNEEDEILQEKFLKQHIDSISTHISGLGSKNYQTLGITQPDYILMFLANEPALTLALKADSSLFEKALGKNIVLVSSSTLLATLRTISYIWKTDNQNKNAKEIANQAGKLYDKFVGFTADLNDLGKRMDSASGAYKKAMNKLSEGSGNLVRQTEKLKKLGASSTKQIDTTLIEKAIDD